MDAYETERYHRMRMCEDGFIGMLEASRSGGIQRSSIQMEEPRLKMGFRAMLEDASGNHSKGVEPEPKLIIRGFGRGFIGMCEEARRPAP